jgi:nitrogenase-stabilizing/protective protein
MGRSLEQFNQLVNAEDYLEFFQIAYDPQIVNVNRLHILQKFSTLIQPIALKTALTESEKLEQYQAALEAAYNTFTSSTSLDEKLFKVFNDKPQNVVLLSDIGSD